MWIFTRDCVEALLLHQVIRQKVHAAKLWVLVDQENPKWNGLDKCQLINTQILKALLAAFF